MNILFIKCIYFLFFSSIDKKTNIFLVTIFKFSNFFLKYCIKSNFINLISINMSRKISLKALIAILMLSTTIICHFAPDCSDPSHISQRPLSYQSSSMRDDWGTGGSRWDYRNDGNRGDWGRGDSRIDRNRDDR